MARGPLPNPQSRRTNAATIPNSKLPAEGRRGRAPALPATYKLQKAGRAWWNWAWKLPQATRWEKGDLYFVARRAQLEDDLAEIARADSLTSEVSASIAVALSADSIDVLRDTLGNIESTLRTLKGLAAGRTAVMKEMRELDNRLGLNPKALADLRWVIEDTDQSEVPAPRSRSKKPTKAKKKSKSKAATKRSKVAKLDDYRDRYS